jgi:predicted phosphoribosyltransferase
MGHQRKQEHKGRNGNRSSVWLHQKRKMVLLPALHKVAIDDVSANCDRLVCSTFPTSFFSSPKQISRV